MAYGKRSLVLANLSGSIGDELTIRRTAAGAVVGKKVGSYKRPPTDDQKVVRRKFSDCVKYAQAAINDPLLKEIYSAKARKGRSTFNIAYMDAYTLPEVAALTSDNYDGTPGSYLTIAVDNIVDVNTVKVKISKADGTLVESGDATIFLSKWRYTATALNDAVAGSLVEIKATNPAENVGTALFELA